MAAERMTLSVADYKAMLERGVHVHDFESLSFTIDEPLDGERLRTFWGDEKPHSSLVFIGPTGSLDASALKGGLDDCVVSRS